MIDDNESTFEQDDKAAQTDGKEPASSLDRVNLFRRLRRWFLQDKRHSEDWRSEAERCFDFVAGRQWSAEDMAKLREQMRPVIAFNRIAPVISAVCGTEVTNRQEVRYMPRQPGAALADEMLTSAAKWFRDECNGEDEESDAFWDTCVCGMGWTETRMDFERDEDGAPLLDRTDALEMYWDAAAKARNLEDARRIWRVKKVPLDEAKALVGEFDAEDEDFDATWANFDDRGSKDETRQEARFYRPTKDGGMDYDEDLITLVECQWWERETVHAVAGQNGVEFLSEEEMEVALARYAELGEEPPKSAKQTRRKYFRAWLGEKVLAEPEEAPFGEHFSYQAITGYRDRNKGTFYGLVRSMLDPQMWANKWLSQTMHILNTSAKGGAIIEDGVFVDEREAEKNWSAPDKFVRVRKGVLTDPNGPKLVAKFGSEMPQGYTDMMEFALTSIRDASGVNLELLGQKDTEQAGVLEAQRKRQAMAVLAVLFDSLRRYRKNQGRLMLYLIQNFIPDGTLIRVSGPSVGMDDQAGMQAKQQYIQFIRQPDWGKFDVVVDDAPSSPQQKDLAWATLMQMLPAAAKLPPQLMGFAMKYSPMPASAVEEFNRVLGQMQQQAAEQAQQQPNPLQIKAQEAQMDMQLEQQKHQQSMQMEQEKHAMQMQVERDKHAFTMQSKLEGIEREGAARKAVDESNPATKANTDLAQSIAAMAQGIGSIQQGIAALIEHETAETELIRDPASGRAMGARKVKRPPVEAMN